jgi:hypothetical protein
MLVAVVKNILVDPSGDLQSLACWECGIESRLEQGYLSVMSVVRQSSLQYADLSSRGVLPIVVCRSVISKPEQ